MKAQIIAEAIGLAVAAANDEVRHGEAVMVLSTCFENASDGLREMLRGLPENDNGAVDVMAYALLSKDYGEVIVLQVCAPGGLRYELHHYPNEQTLRGPRYRKLGRALQEHHDYVAECLRHIDDESYGEVVTPPTPSNKTRALPSGFTDNAADRDARIVAARRAHERKA